MNIVRTPWLTALIALLGTLPCDAAPPACVAPGVGLATQHRVLYQQLNDYRISQGLKPLTYSKTLELSANEHAADMAHRQFFDHADPDGVKAPQRAQAAGFCHGFVGENIYWGKNSVRTPTDAMTGWKRSPGHNANMLRRGFKYVGIGFYQLRRRDGIHTYWVQVFAFHKKQRRTTARALSLSPESAHTMSQCRPSVLRVPAVE